MLVCWTQTLMQLIGAIFKTIPVTFFHSGFLFQCLRSFDLSRFPSLPLLFF